MKNEAQTHMRPRSNGTFSAASHGRNHFCAAKLREMDLLKSLLWLQDFTSGSRHCGRCPLNSTLFCPSMSCWMGVQEFSAIL